MKNKKLNEKQINPQPQKDELSKMIRNKNFIVGLGAIIVLLFALGLGITRISQSSNQSKVQVKNSLAQQLNTVDKSDRKVTPTLAATSQPENKTASRSAAIS